MRYIKLIFLVVVVSFMMGSGTKEMKLTEGIVPGCLAPKIKLQDVSLKNDAYILLQCWAAYDAESRMNNVWICNKVSNMGLGNLKLVSIAFDERKSIFQETIKADGLDPQTQFNDRAGHKSEIYEDYHLNEGFGNWLINPEGVVVAKNVKPSEILKVLQQHGVQ